MSYDFNSRSLGEVKIQSRSFWRLIKRAIGHVVLGGAALTLGGCDSGIDCLRGERASGIEGKGELVFEAVLGYWAEEGVFPNALRDCCSKAQLDQLGTFEYSNRGANIGFSLIVGNYDSCGWEISRGFGLREKEEAEAGIRKEALELARMMMSYFLDNGSAPVGIESLGIQKDWGLFGPWRIGVTSAGLGQGFEGKIAQEKDASAYEFFFRSKDWYHDS